MISTVHSRMCALVFFCVHVQILLYCTDPDVHYYLGSTSVQSINQADKQISRL